MLLLHEEREFVEIGVRHAPDGVSFSTHIFKENEDESLLTTLNICWEMIDVCLSLNLKCNSGHCCKSLIFFYKKVHLHVNSGWSYLLLAISQKIT